jgi:NAD(P)-dependent dehydrogenase (short-subunit alcohol dehydrogenase family)
MESWTHQRYRWVQHLCSGLPLWEIHHAPGPATGSMGTPVFREYSATKAAIRNLARSWALDLKGTGIRVNVVSPGTTPTRGLLNGLAKTEMREALLAYLASQAPLERAGKPDDTAAVACSSPPMTAGL